MADTDNALLKGVVFTRNNKNPKYLAGSLTTQAFLVMRLNSCNTS